MDNVETYSHRKRGFHRYRLDLDSKCDLNILQETNFGYGSVRYFRSTLSCRGVRAINIRYLIFFHYAGKVAFSNSTYSYEVDEASFEDCFSDIVRIHTEYLLEGEAFLVEKYFRKPLADLADLLTIVANTDTFLQITTLERFNALTSDSWNELTPNRGFSSGMFELSADDMRASDELVATILRTDHPHDIAACENNPTIKVQVRQILAPYGRSKRGLHNIVRKDLIRSRIIKGLAASLPADCNIGGLAKKLIPPEDGIFVETYEGYDLISMRVDKAESVIKAIARLREMATITNLESTIDSILSSCTQIGEQSRRYITEEINPELGRQVSERNRVAALITTTEAEVLNARYFGGDVDWFETQLRKLKRQRRTLDESIAELKQQKRKLGDYIKKVAALPAPW